MARVFVNQYVAYEADPSLYGRMLVVKVVNGLVTCELDNERLEVFKEGELGLASRFFVEPQPIDA